MRVESLVIVLYLFLFVFVHDAWSQADYFETTLVSAKPIRVPTVVVPDEVKKTGLGGEVRVQVAVDKDGNVTSVEGVYGPGGVCQQVTRSDVVAMRSAARDAAMQTLFSPATRNGKPIGSLSWVNVNFPMPAPKDKLTVTTPSGEVKTYPVIAGGTTSSNASNPLLLNGKALSLPKPPYPPAARAVRASGAVSVQVAIDEDGSVFSATPISGHPLLRYSASAAACTAKFTPTLLEGAPIKVSGVIVYNFVP